MLLAAFGGGFTWGGIYMTWAYDAPKAKTADSAGDKEPAKGATSDWPRSSPASCRSCCPVRLPRGCCAKNKAAR